MGDYDHEHMIKACAWKEEGGRGVVFKMQNGERRTPIDMRRVLYWAQLV